jgi:hypothetical protein
MQVNFAFIQQGSLTFRHLYFSSVLQIFSPLKFHRPQAGLDARTLGPIASMINTTPPRATILKLKYDNQVNSLQLITSWSNFLSLLSLSEVLRSLSLDFPATCQSFLNFEISLHLNTSAAMKVNGGSPGNRFH